MLRHWTMLIFLLGGWLLSHAQVEFPLEYYSFAEIAQRMSVEGRKVDCARDLQQRLALIHLKSRSWQQARELLETALDVRFRKISDAENRWLLERDPETVRKERHWREQLAAYIEKRRNRDSHVFRLMVDESVPVEEAIKQIMEAYEEDRDPFASTDEAQLKTQLAQIIKYFRKLPMEQALREWRAFQRMQKRLSDFMKRDFRADANENDPFGAYRQFLKENPLSSFGFSQELLDWAQRAATDESDETLMPIRQMMGSEESGGAVDPTLMQMLMLNSLGMFASGYGQVWARDALVAQLRPPITVLETIENGAVARDYTVSLPPEQLAWQLNDVEGKLVPLDSPTPISTPLVAIAAWEGRRFSVAYQFPNALAHPDSFTAATGGIEDTVPLRWEPARLKRLLTQVDDELARAYEKAYEQHQQLASQPPVNQPIKATMSEQTVLVEVVHRWAQEQQQEVVMEVLGVLRWSFREQRGSLTQRLDASNVPYLLEQRDGVWILRCWSAFVERVGDYPLAAVRDLLRSDYSYEAWRRFYRAVNAEQARWLLTISWYPSWNPSVKPEPYPSGVLSPELGKAWLVMAILESLPAEQRERFWNPPDDAPAPTLELARLPLEVRTRIAQVLSLWRAALIHANLEPLNVGLLSPPNTWMGGLTLQREHGEWKLKTTVVRAPGEDARAVVLLETRLPDNRMSVGMPDVETEKPAP
ncbi:MAG: hypothetical protein N2554_08220 [Fimbriimonadales bacterium]|nr:hypothetical protein [Fimbriimonadales bacterium]